MKIGIITTHSALNCGAVLQAFALQTQLEKLGYVVEFIDIRGKDKKSIRDFIGKGFMTTWYRWENLYNGWKHKKNDSFGRILKKGETQFSSFIELQQNPPKCDIYIAGSDQIWNIGGDAKSINRHYYLDFGPAGTKRIAFAASLGQCIVPQHLESEIRSLLLKFDAISVREENGTAYVRSLVGDKKEVFQIADPTILLQGSEYLKIAENINNNNNNNNPYIASYILAQLGEKQLKIIDYIKTKASAKIINLRNPTTCIRLQNAMNKVVTPYQWISYIYQSKLVICCSFHAVIFSLIFHKPFVVITPYINQRINSILKPLDLMEYVIDEFDQNKIDLLLEKQIDWKNIDRILNCEKQTSIAFLQKNLI